MGRFPSDNAAAGLPNPELLMGNYVTAVRVEEGAIHITFGNRADKSIANTMLSLRPAFPTGNPGGRFPGGAAMRLRSRVWRHRVAI